MNPSKNKQALERLMLQNPASRVKPNLIIPSRSALHHIEPNRTTRHAEMVIKTQHCKERRGQYLSINPTREKVQKRNQKHSKHRYEQHS